MLVDETGVTISLVTLPNASLTLIRDNSSFASVMYSAVLVLEHFADAFAMVNLMGKVLPVTVGTLRGNCWFVRLLFNGFWKPQNWPATVASSG